VKKATIYIRVSSADQVSGTSLCTQEADCRAWCARNGYAVARLFSDEGESAKTADRPGLLASLEYARKERVDCWCCWKLDRAARDQRDGLGIRAALRAHGCTLASATEPIADDPLGNLMAGMLFGIAQFDNEIRSARAKRAMQDVAMRGGWVNPLPTGYQWAPRVKGELPMLVPDPTLGPVIAAALQALAGGASAAQALRMLGEAGLSPQTASKALRAPVYGGIIRGSLTGGKDIPAAFPGLVTADVWRRAQAALRRNTGRNATGRHPDFPLAAIACCSVCGRPVRGYHAAGKGGRRVPYYDCKDGHARIQAARAHAGLAAIFAERLLPAVTDLRARIARHVAAETELHRTARSAAQSRLTAAETRLDRLTDSLADGTIDADTYRRRSASYREEIAACTAALAAKQRSLARLADCLDEVCRRMSNPAELWKNIDFTGRKRLMDYFGQRIEICPDKTIRTQPNVLEQQQVATPKGSKTSDGAPTQAEVELAANLISVVLGGQAA